MYAIMILGLAIKLTKLMANIITAVYLMGM